MVSHWQIHPADPPRARTLADRLGIHQITAQLLLNRGVTTPTDAERFFRPTIEALGDPFMLPEMARGVDRIRQAIASREPILIFGDSDVDGLTASVILYEALQGLGAVVRIKASNRITDGYGLPQSVVTQLCRSAIKLVILVDCGTNQPEAVEALAARGIETLIIDHHVPLKRWAKPAALINPHHEGHVGRELCSAGLAFKVAQALWKETASERLRDALDLAALGTLADCSPLVKENRILVSEGLERIVQSRRNGLRRLCEATDTLKPDVEHVIRRLVPRLNASGRLGDPAAVWNLLHSAGEERVDEWLALAESAHATTKQLYRQFQGEAFEQVNRLHFRDQYVVVVSRPGWHQGLMGPLASQLAERYNRPAIAIAINRQHGVGSGRSVAMFNLLNVLQQCEELLVAFGGHAHACGLTIAQERVEEFRVLVNRHAREQLGREGLLRTRTMDVELPLEALGPAWVQDVERFAPFGMGNPRPTAVIRHLLLEVASPRTGWVSDGSVRLRVKGTLPTPVPGARYDVVAVPALQDGAVVLTVSETRLSTGPSGRAPSADTLYRRALV